MSQYFKKNVGGGGQTSGYFWACLLLLFILIWLTIPCETALKKSAFLQASVLAHADHFVM